MSYNQILAHAKIFPQKPARKPKPKPETVRSIKKFHRLITQDCLSHQEAADKLKKDVKTLEKQYYRYPEYR